MVRESLTKSRVTAERARVMREVLVHEGSPRKQLPPVKRRHTR
jgi:hypothetical protein